MEIKARFKSFFGLSRSDGLQKDCELREQLASDKREVATNLRKQGRVKLAKKEEEEAEMLENYPGVAVRTWLGI